MSKLKSTCLRFRRSSLELKIDPKTPQVRVKNDFEEQRTRKGEKESKKDNKNEQYEFPKCSEGV